ncbi:hypothetical protein ACEPAG_3126 [Sanghuangporus baumii]
MSMHADQNRQDTESSDMNTDSPTGSSWLGGSFCGSPIGVDLPLQSTAQRLAGSLQDSAVPSLPFANQVAMGQQDGRSAAITSPRGFQEHSFGQSDQQNVQTEAAQYTLDYALSFQGDSQIQDFQQGFMQQAASFGFESQAPMRYYELENLPQTMHNSQYPPISGHATLSQNSVDEGALAPVQQHIGHFQVVPNDQTQHAPLSPVDLDVMANFDWNWFNVTEEDIMDYIAECARLGIEI